MQSIPYSRYTTSEINALTNTPLDFVVFNTDENKLAVNTIKGWVLIDSTVMQTVLFHEDWESRSFVTNGWVAVNDVSNKWVIGTADKHTGGYGVYISNDAGETTNYSNNTAQVSHLYVDVQIPAGISSASLLFYHKGEGEVGYDYMRIYKATTTYTPVAGSLPDSNATLIGSSQYNDKSSFVEESIDLGVDEAGTTVRYIFSWKNDGSVGVSPAAIIDNIKIKVA